MTPLEALNRLKTGNERFVKGLRCVEALVTTANRRYQLAEDGQKPFAIILSCSDSRVPAEIVFDCGLGDLFVVRVAGNIVAPSLLGSIEFAAQSFGTALCLVLGHTNCGAVSAAFDAHKKGIFPESENILKIISGITPAVSDSIKETTIQNVKNSIAAIRNSKIVADLETQGKLTLSGGVYDLHTGVVDIFLCQG